MTSASLPLLRSLLREGRKVNDYNFRAYAVRRIKAGFRMKESAQGEELTAAMKEGEEQLQVLRRQQIIGNLYPSETSVMEKL
mmetsp:Transcript_3914/g.5830  ORF Transcript_3914/g.5830 Transcript_3914/m.5830 type:complete len:82 (-) Transcript_3914:433-678(-)|eukprot:CAMPEP_0194076698 /NCGR_PEP_ID=MMETSP0149-20130528/3469_1 /TAXON_ID=122233 /ORGANISM="Chaetoceros debilis, Strain MM31A-1" /LENGTH=81 /DNA_ID=CAMNT_0038757529 /DNA_START=44 /DNA_END=289 /DNA_ORIENTATION=+